MLTRIPRALKERCRGIAACTIMYGYYGQRVHSCCFILLLIDVAEAHGIDQRHETLPFAVEEQVSFCLFPLGEADDRIREQDEVIIQLYG